MSRIAEAEVLDLLARLVEKSLVLYEEDERGSGRYRLLETVRQYARDRLVETGGGECRRARHQHHFLTLTEEARAHLLGPEQDDWLERLEADHGNLRAALEFCAEDSHGGEPGLRLAGCLWKFWDIRGYFIEGRERCRAILAHAGAQTSSEERSAALNAAGWLAYRQNDYAAAEELLEESVRISRRINDAAGLAGSLRMLGASAMGLCDRGRARALTEEALALHRELGDQRGEAMSLNNLGFFAELQGDDATARSFYEQARSIIAKVDDRAGLSLALGNLGRIVSRQGDLAQARSLLAECLLIDRAQRDRRGAAADLQMLAGVELQEARYVRAARLLEAAALLREQIAAPPEFTGQEEIDRGLVTLREALPEEELAAALSAGRAMDWEQAIAYALGEADG